MHEPLDVTLTASAYNAVMVIASCHNNGNTMIMKASGEDTVWMLKIAKMY
jgi:hypothetical protein